LALGLKFLQQGPGAGQGSGPSFTVGVETGVFSDGASLGSIAAQYPSVRFEPLGADWLDSPAALKMDVLIVKAHPASLSTTLGWLTRSGIASRVVIVLEMADIASTRELLQEGAADVLPAPVSDAAIAVSLERMLRAPATAQKPPARAGEIVAVLKAGGGVGATSLTTQVGVALASQGVRTCIADLDLQFGEASLYLDLPNAVSISELISNGGDLSETPFATALTAHSSGLRLLGGAREFLPLDTLAPGQIDDLILGLRRDFTITLVDLPANWTAWTARLLALADRILLVTQLSVPHIHMVKRQMQVLATQRLEMIPLTLVCNGVSADHIASVSIKAAEKALGRGFDVVAPDDRPTMLAAINQGVALSSVKRGTKLEKAVADLAEKIADGLVEKTQPPSRRIW